MVGIVLVSHSRALALSVQELVRSMTGPALPLAIAAGTGDNHAELGTDAVEIAEAIVAVKGMLGEPVVPVDYGRVPWAIYCHPEVAFCGMTEAQAKEKGIPVVTKKDPFGGNSRAQILGETEGVVKIVAEQRPDGSAGRILGVHMAGPWVTEQLGAGYLAVNWEALPEEVAYFIQPHPSLSESFGETMLALTGRGMHIG